MRSNLARSLCNQVAEDPYHSVILRHWVGEQIGRANAVSIAQRLEGRQLQRIGHRTGGRPSGIPFIFLRINRDDELHATGLSFLRVLTVKRES